jgi:hypothetical protein
MSTFVSLSELKDGDIFLYHGDNFISRMIRLFDGGDYSHAGVYSNAHILEAIGSGIEYRSVTESTNGVPYVDVFRFKSKDNIWIGSDGFPVQPVIDRINHYNENRERYGYEQILLLAILTSTRRLPFQMESKGVSPRK